jgi:hypothetical protein
MLLDLFEVLRSVGNSASLCRADLRALPQPPPRQPSPELEAPHELGDTGVGNCLDLHAEPLIAASSSAGHGDWGAATGRPFVCVLGGGMRIDGVVVSSCGQVPRRASPGSSAALAGGRWLCLALGSAAGQELVRQEVEDNPDVWVPHVS